MTGCEMGSVPLTGADWLADAVTSLHGAYAHIHPYMAVALCLAGTVMNIVTVIVLTRPSMLSPVNTLLCAVALCDILVMSSVLIFVSHFLIAAATRCDVLDYDRLWAYFLFVHAQTTVIFHATSIWLTVLLAQIRVYSIRRATSGPSEALSSRAMGVLAAATLIVVALINIPNFLTFEIVEMQAENWLSCLLPESESGESRRKRRQSDSNETQGTYGTVFHVRPSEKDCGLLKTAFWTNGILFKVVPCMMLTFSIIALLKIIKDVSHRRKSLAQVMNKKRMPRDHTTPMLVAVLSIFLVAELPQGILHVCNAIYSNETFYQKIYLPLGDMMDLLSLLNSAVNFIIYCAMSRKFRCVFLQLFISCLPNSFIGFFSKYLHDWSGLAELEISRMKPSGATDLTKTEQLALTSHRVSATSMLIRTASRENLNLTANKMYSGNLLAVEQPGGRSLSIPRVSFDAKQKFEARSSLEIHEIKLAVPEINKVPTRSVFRIRPPYETFQRLWKRASGATDSSPQRRINIIQYETSTAGY